MCQFENGGWAACSTALEKQVSKATEVDWFPDDLLGNEWELEVPLNETKE